MVHHSPSSHYRLYYKWQLHCFWSKKSRRRSRPIKVKLKQDPKIILPWIKKQSQLIELPLNNIISIQDMSSGFKKWREDTSTSPSQRHLGHYQCLLKPDEQKSKYRLKYFNSTMLAIHNTIINLATSTGIPLNRWTLSEVIMIQKWPNNPRINRLRVVNK